MLYKFIDFVKNTSVGELKSLQPDRFAKFSGIDIENVKEFLEFLVKIRMAKRKIEVTCPNCSETFYYIEGEMPEVEMECDDCNEVFEWGRAKRTGFVLYVINKMDMIEGSEK